MPHVLPGGARHAASPDPGRPSACRGFAPPPEQQVPRETLDREMAAAGLEVVASYDFLPEQYFVNYAAP